MFHLWTARSLSETLENKSHDSLQGDFPHKIEKGKGGNKRRQRNRKEKQEKFSKEQSTNEIENYFKKIEVDNKNLKEENKKMNYLLEVSKDVVAGVAKDQEKIKSLETLLKKIKSEYNNEIRTTIKLENDIKNLEEDLQKKIKEEFDEHVEITDREHGIDLQKKDEEISRLKTALLEEKKLKIFWFNSVAKAEADLKQVKKDNLHLRLEIDPLENKVQSLQKLNEEILYKFYKVLEEFEICTTIEEVEKVSKKYKIDH